MTKTKTQIINKAKYKYFKITKTNKTAQNKINKPKNFNKLKHHWGGQQGA